MSGSKKDLLEYCKILGLKNMSSKTKAEIKETIKLHQDKHDIYFLGSSRSTPVKYVYHSADIHIRTLDRHEEYRIVFQKLYDTIKNSEDLESSVFVICGDIFHNRDRLVSESIILFNSFIEKMSSIIDVVCILGNHDTFNHGDRLDTLTGIVDIKEFSNFHFLKTSGEYKYRNIDFVVSSLLDNKFIKGEEVSSSEDRTKIALYHGGLTGSKIDDTYEIPDSHENFKVKDFKNFDIVMLGDIHKLQFLTPTIAYPGSLIQQNHKEDSSHGILRWDITTKDSQFIEIPNDYGFLTIEYRNKELLLCDVVFPKYSRIRIVHTYREEIDIDSVKKLLEEKTNVLSISKEILATNAKSTVTESGGSVDTALIHRDSIDKEHFTKLISEYPEEKQNKLLQIHTQNILKLKEETDQDTISSWEIERVEFKNVFIYGGDVVNTLDFSDIRGVIGVLGDNAQGKTSILNIILYCLFGNSFRSKNTSNRNIINKFKNNYFIKMTIKTENNEKYVIHREGKNKSRKNGIKGMDETVSLYNIIGESTVNLTDSTKSTTMNKIHKLLGLTDKEMFLLTNMMGYSNYVSLLNMTSSDISSTFSHMFNIGHYRQIYNNAMKHFKKLNEDIRVEEKHLENVKNNRIDLPRVESDLKDVNSKLSTDTEELEKLTFEIENILDAKRKIESNVSSKTPSCLKDEDTIRDKVEVDPHPGIGYPREVLLVKIKEMKRYSVCENKKLNTGLTSVEKITNKISSLCSQRVSIKKPRVSSGKEYEKLLKMEKFSIEALLDDFKIIGSKGKSNTVTIDRDLYDDVLEFLVDINDKSFLETRVKIIEYEKYIEDVKHNDKINESIKNHEEDLYIMNHDKYHSYVEKLEYIDAVEKLKQIEEYRKNIEMIEQIREYENKIKTFNMQKNIITKSINELNRKQCLLENKISLHANTEEDISTIEEVISDTKQERSVYEIYKNITNDRVLPKMILQDTIKKVEYEANILIYRIVGLYIVLNTIEDDGKWEISINKNNVSMGVEHLSGYERFVVNVGVKIALDKYKFYSGVRMFFIDEAFDCVSEENFDKIDDLFDIIKKYYKNIMIISHNQNLKKKTDHIIHIDSDFINSKIKCIT